MSGPPQALPSSQETVATAFSPRRRGKRVLLIEDEPLTRAILLTQLRLAGLDVEVAATGGLALKKIPGGQLDAMVLELALPDMPGPDVIEEARRDPEFAGRPVFVYTSAPPGSALSSGVPPKPQAPGCSTNCRSRRCPGLGGGRRNHQPRLRDRSPDRNTA